jgi:hypothetical protein
MYAAVLLLPAVPAAADQMYAVDLHAHSTVSADARADLGTDARSARAAGLNALFLTDHNQASDFSISTHTANNSFFDTPGHDDLTRWTTFGTGVSQVTSPVHSGTAATWPELPRRQRRRDDHVLALPGLARSRRERLRVGLVRR